MRCVIVMDPVSTVLVNEDTTFALMLELEARGHRVDHCLVQDVHMRDGRVHAAVRRARSSREAQPPVQLGAAELVCLDDVDLVFIRKDPPFDEHYLWLTLLLEHLRGKTAVVNDPRGLRDANEKLYALHFSEVMPTTTVDSDKARIKAFVESVGGQAVIKPVDGHGGEGVFAIALDDKNINGLIELVTRGGTRVAMVQAFIPQVREGDKRILLVDGEPLGAILRVPRGDDVRSNIHVGGSVVQASLTEADQRIVQAVAPKLRADGLVFVGLDVIGGKLTEVNVTSPTGIQQMMRLDGVNYAARVIDAFEARVVR
ncbi:MAG: glutathione synthase [Sandaracinaceae bacterium]|nr:glutathione synthase [Sandaracinaceae bacterium]